MAELGPRYPLVDCKWAVAGSFRSLLNLPQRLMYDSRARAIAHGDMTLPTVRSQSDVQALVDYLDGVFATMTTQHSFLGSPYPAIAWSPNQVIAEQADSDAGRPLPSVRYLDRPLQLSDLRSSAHGWDNLVRRVQAVFLAQREQASEAREGFVGVRGRLDVIEGQMDDMAATLLRVLRAVRPQSRNEGVDEAVDML